MASRKELCIWLVAPGGGKVRKLRVSTLLLCCLLGLIACFGIGLVFTAGDYARLQISKVILHNLLNSVSKERDVLQAQNDALKEQVLSFKDSQTKTVRLQNDIKQRLMLLSSTLETATSLSLFADNELESNLDGIGVGGAEQECDPKIGKCTELGDNVSLGFGSKDLAVAIRQDLSDKSGKELVAALDLYLDLIESIPMGNPGNAHINSGYGKRISPWHGKVVKHEGVDYALPHGSQIFATASGTVKTVKRNPTYGLMIDIQHSDKVVTRFAHLSSALVEVGDKVCRGQVIGLVGSTGHSTGPHLHYEVRINDVAQNPAKFIQLADKLSPSLFKILNQ